MRLFSFRSVSPHPKRSTKELKRSCRTECDVHMKNFHSKYVSVSTKCEQIGVFIDHQKKNYMSTDITASTKLFLTHKLCRQYFNCISTLMVMVSHQSKQLTRYYHGNKSIFTQQQSTIHIPSSLCVFANRKKNCLKFQLIYDKRNKKRRWHFHLHHCSGNAH